MREGGREREEREEDASSQVTCTLATSVLATLYPSMTIPVWAKMLFKFRQHGPLVFLLEKYRVF